MKPVLQILAAREQAYPEAVIIPKQKEQQRNYKAALSIVSCFVFSGDNIMTLSALIDKNYQPIIRELEKFARSLIPAATDMTPLALRNHIEEILEFIVTDMESAQTNEEQIEKSHGAGKQKKRTSTQRRRNACRPASGWRIQSG